MPYSIEVGMDVHKMFSVFAAVNGSGEVMSCEKLSNDTGVFDQYFRRLGTQPIRVTLEASRGINWILDYLSRRHIAYTVSNPFLNRAIAHVHCKNDKYDAQTLADLSRANLIAPCYVPSRPIRELRDLIAHRAKLVQITTKLVRRG